MNDLKKTKLTSSIIKKWNKQGFFIRFINGNKLDCRRDNLEQVSIIDSMIHINEWVVDWDLNLTCKEKLFVKNNLEFRKGLFIR